MKKILNTLLIAVLFSGICLGQNNEVRSVVYKYDAPSSESTVTSEVMFDGMETDFKKMKMETFGIPAGRSFSSDGAEEEILIIVKDGVVTVSLDEEMKTFGAGSIALAMPGASIQVKNTTKDMAAIYVMSYISKEPVDIARGEDEGGSFMMDWYEIAYNPHGNGGIRNYYNKPTAMCKRMEMHLSTLKTGIKSHEPHTHRASEIVLMVKGDTQMQIGEGFYNGTVGAAYYLGSNILHAIQNKDEEPVMYFAFQFE